MESGIPSLISSERYGELLIPFAEDVNIPTRVTHMNLKRVQERLCGQLGRGRAIKRNLRCWVGG
jgi:hypothetical protein